MDIQPISAASESAKAYDAFARVVVSGPEGPQEIQGPIVAARPASTVDPGNVVIYDINQNRLVTKVPHSIGLA